MTSRPQNDYLFLDEQWPEKRKTAIVKIHSRSSFDLLGEIRWFGRWRRYAFFPAPDTIWDPGCLDTINAYIEALMADRRLG